VIEQFAIGGAVHKNGDEPARGAEETQTRSLSRSSAPDNYKAASWLAAVGFSAAAVIVGSAKLLSRASRPRLELRGKVVLITGGSRGLGFALAREFGNQGARLALCARDQNELREACDRLSQDSIEAEPFVVDISRESEIAPLIQHVIERFGSIDILINNAGHIKVGPFQTFGHDEFEAAMNVMFWAPLNLTFAVLPQMQKQHGGSIINITSVGGRVSMPHLLPYCCAKFAAVGFSTGLSTELESKGIHVLTVVPGLMRTGSYLQAQFKGEPKQEFAWFGLLGNLPGFSVAADYAARSIREAVEQHKHVCTISLPARILIACDALIPETTRTMLASVNRYLLPTSESTKDLVPGKEVNPKLNAVFHLLTALGQLAARDLNE
jgi:short-subunit dehydrogenase